MGIIRKAKKIAECILKQNFIRIITHCDCDGVAGAYYAKMLLDNFGIKHEIKFVKYLDIEKESKDEFIWLIDIGNGSIEKIKKRNIKCAISDHHIAKEYYENALNPFYYGMDGEVDISAAGLTYLIAKNFCKVKPDFAIIGAIGDLQDLKYGKLVGMNRRFIPFSNIEINRDIRAYGRDKPLHRMISCEFPFIKKPISFLKKLGVDYSKRWNDLSIKEKRKVLSALIKAMLEKGYGYETICNIYGEVYELNGNDVRVYSTLLNSMAKVGYGKEALKICIEGDFEKAEKFLEEHRKRICKYINFAIKRMNEYDALSYFHGGCYIEDTVIGTIAGIVLKQERIDMPIIAFAENENGIKVSARAPYGLIEKGLNLCIAIKKTAKMLGGSGGGHKAAAGAIIPKGSELNFLQILNDEVKNQLSL